MPANHAYRFIAEPDEMNEISMEKWCVKFVVGENGRNSKKPTRTQFRPSCNPYEVTEIRTRDPTVVSERLTPCSTGTQSHESTAHISP